MKASLTKTLLLPLCFSLFLTHCKLSDSAINGNAKSPQLLKKEISFYQGLLKTNSNHHKAHLALGWAFLHDNQYAQAITSFNNAIRLSESNVVAYIGLGIAYQKSGHIQYARHSYEKAKEFKPTWYLIDFQIAKLHLQKNNISKALAKVDDIMPYDKELAHQLINEIYP